MSFDWAGWLLWITNVPNFKLFVVTYCGEDELVKIIPGNVFNNRTVSFKIKDCLLVKHVLVGGIDIPDTNPAIITTRQQKPFLHWVPFKAISLLSMTEEWQIWFDFIIKWSLWMLEIIKQFNFSIRSFGRNDLLVLWHISCTVDFSSMINLNINWNSGLLNVSNTSSTDAVGVVV